MTMEGMKIEFRTKTKTFTRSDCFERSSIGKHILFHTTLKMAKDTWMRKSSVGEMSLLVEEMM